VCDLEKTNLVNEEAMTPWGVIAPREKKLFYRTIYVLPDDGPLRSDRNM